MTLSTVLLRTARAVLAAALCHVPAQAVGATLPWPAAACQPADTLRPDSLPALPSNSLPPGTGGAGTSAETHAADIAARLDSLVRALSDPRATVSVCVADASSGLPLYAHDARLSLRPASCQKVITAWAAIATLGSRGSLGTRLLTDGTPADTLLEGNLYLYSEMDPLFGQQDLQAFADTLARRGIRRIAGDLVLDESYKDATRMGEGWCWDDDNPVLAPLLCEGKDRMAAAFCEALERAGIVLAGTLRMGCTPGQTTLLAECSHTLDALLLPMMKDSRNLFAESLYYAIGRAAGRRSTSLEAAAVVARLTARLGLSPDDYRTADGSGLSLYNYASAELLCKVLCDVWRDDTQRRHLVPALPVAGTDGTLARRMRRTPADGNVRAKTGTLAGISTLAGYATAADGRTLALAIFCSGHRPGAAFRRIQDALCIAMTAP